MAATKSRSSGSISRNVRRSAASTCFIAREPQPGELPARLSNRQIALAASDTGLGALLPGGQLGCWCHGCLLAKSLRGEVAPLAEKAFSGPACKAGFGKLVQRPDRVAQHCAGL